MDIQNVAAAESFPPELFARLVASRDATAALMPKFEAAAGYLAALDRRAAVGEAVDLAEWEAAESELVAIRRAVAREVRVFALRLKDAQAAVAPVKPDAAEVAQDAGAVS